jgi:hypothetical protein
LALSAFSQVNGTMVCALETTKPATIKPFLRRCGDKHMHEIPAYSLNEFHEVMKHYKEIEYVNIDDSTVPLFQRVCRVCRVCRSCVGRVLCAVVSRCLTLFFSRSRDGSHEGNGEVHLSALQRHAGSGLQVLRLAVVSSPPLLFFAYCLALPTAQTFT